MLVSARDRWRSASALLLQLGCVARARLLQPALDLIPSSLAPASPCSPFSVRSTPAAALAPPARASVPPHTHTKPPAHSPGRPPPLTARHSPPNSVITVCYRSQPGVLEMYVVKRSGKKEPVHFDKITARIAKLCTDERAAVSLRKRV